MRLVFPGLAHPRRAGPHPTLRVPMGIPKMGNAEPRILVFAGSSRVDSSNRKLARAAAPALRKEGGKITYIGLKDYPMPLYDVDFEASEGLPPAARALQRLPRDHDAFAIASPEYNGSFSPLVKNVVDWVSRPDAGERPLAAFHGKVAGLMSASPGPSPDGEVCGILASCWR